MASIARGNAAPAERLISEVRVRPDFPAVTAVICDVTHEQVLKPFCYAAGRKKAMQHGNGPNGISKRGAILFERAKKIIDAA